LVVVVVGFVDVVVGGAVVLVALGAGVLVAVGAAVVVVTGVLPPASTCNNAVIVDGGGFDKDVLSGTNPT
jgi:hypothetical protein